MTVLVVDDDFSVLRVAAAVLKRAGYEVVTASNAKSALAVCEEHHAQVAVVVSDVCMPGMSGFDLAKSICALERPIPVILMSGYWGDGALTAGVAAEIEAVGFLEKPFAASDLLRQVRLASAKMAATATAGG